MQKQAVDDPENDNDDDNDNDNDNDDDDKCHNFRTYAGFEFFSLCTTYTSPLPFHCPASCALASGDLHSYLVHHLSY